MPAQPKAPEQTGEQQPPTMLGEQPQQQGGVEGTRPDRSARAVAPVLNQDPTHDFTFLVRADRMDVFITDQGPEVLPALWRFTHEPGTKGVRSKKGSFNGDAGPALSKLTQPMSLDNPNGGWVMIPHDMEVEAFGKKRPDYVHLFDGRRGAETVAMDVWTRPYVIGASVSFEKDEKGYWAFLRQVLKLIGGLDEGVKRGLKAQLEKLSSDYRKRDDKSTDALLLQKKLEAFAPKKEG